MAITVRPAPSRSWRWTTVTLTLGLGASEGKSMEQHGIQVPMVKIGFDGFSHLDISRQLNVDVSWCIYHIHHRIVGPGVFFCSLCSIFFTADRTRSRRAFRLVLQGQYPHVYGRVQEAVWPTRHGVQQRRRHGTLGVGTHFLGGGGNPWVPKSW